MKSKDTILLAEAVKHYPGLLHEEVKVAKRAEDLLAPGLASFQFTHGEEGQSRMIPERLLIKELPIARERLIRCAVLASLVSPKSTSLRAKYIWQFAITYCQDHFNNLKRREVQAELDNLLECGVLATAHDRYFVTE
jgi:hypothetical protein